MDKKKLRNKKGIRPLAVAYACLVYLFLYLPIFVVIAFSFNTSKMNIKFEGFTFQWYFKMFENTELMQSLVNTLFVAVISTLVCIIIGTICAVGMYKYEFKAKSAVNNLLYIPIIIPEIVLGISLLIFFSSINLSMSMFTLVVAHITFSLPFVVITVRSRLAGYDKSVEEAARDLGATEFRTFTRVTLPIIAPGVLSGGMLAFTMSLDDVVVSFFTSGPNSMTFPIKVYGMVRKGVSPDVNALSTLMIIATILILITSKVIDKKMKKREL